MLALCGEVAQGVLLIWSTLESGHRAAEHLAIGAQRAGRRPEEIDIASLLLCNVAASRQEAFDTMRPTVAFFTGFFPRYNRLMAESGFSEAAQAIRAVWLHGDQAEAARAVPDALLAAVGVVGTPAECRERIEAYRRSGIALPIILPPLRSGGLNPKQEVMDTLRACAP